MDYTEKTCAPRARCRRYTTCKHCAAIRQARFADRAEAAARQMVLPTFYVLVPDDKTPAGIEYARRFFVRQTRPRSGVWSVESGQFQAGHHLNVIADWAPITGTFKGHIYREPVRTHVRAVAAYMTKRERAATREDGFARQTGDFGHVTDWLKTTDVYAPVVAGAVWQGELDPHYLPPSSPGPETPYQTARRWLDALYAERAAAPPKPPRRGTR